MSLPLSSCLQFENSVDHFGYDNCSSTEVASNKLLSSLSPLRKMDFALCKCTTPLLHVINYLPTRIPYWLNFSCWSFANLILPSSSSYTDCPVQFCCHLRAKHRNQFGLRLYTGTSEFQHLISLVLFPNFGFLWSAAMVFFWFCVKSLEQKPALHWTTFTSIWTFATQIHTIAHERFLIHI